MAGKYIKVRCNCGNEQIVYDRTTHKVECSKCKETLAEPQGGRANILGKVVGAAE
jgi:ribosomal protein S27E